MNNRAFTLIELIALIVILLAIFLFVFPNFTNMLKQNDDKKYTNMVDDLCTAGKTYMYSNLDDFPELSNVGSKIELQVKYLITYGSVDKNMENPKTKKSVKDGKLIYQVKEDFTLLCEYEEGNSND